MLFGLPASAVLTRRLLSRCQDPMYHELLAALRHTATASDHFWRCIYSEGLWIPRQKAERLVEWGWGFTDPCSWLEVAAVCICHFEVQECTVVMLVTFSLQLGWVRNPCCSLCSARLARLQTTAKIAHASAFDAAGHRTYTLVLEQFAFRTSFVFFFLA